MTRTLTNTAADDHRDDPRRQADRHRRHHKVRRVAVVQPRDAHFRLLPVRPTLAAMRR